MTFKHFVCFALLLASAGLHAQSKARESAFTLELGNVDDRYLAKGWFYQVASNITHAHADLKFAESESDAARFRQVLPVILSTDAQNRGYYLIKVGTAVQDEVSVKANYENVNKAAKTISSILIRLRSKETPVTQIAICYQSQDETTDNRTFNTMLTDCLNRSSAITDAGNFVFVESCGGRSKNKFRITGKMVSRTNPARVKSNQPLRYIEHRFEVPSLESASHPVSIALPSVSSPSDGTQWNPAGLCSQSRDEIGLLLSLEDDMLIKLDGAQRGDTRSALIVEDQLLQQGKPDVALFLLDFLKERESVLADGTRTRTGALLADICMRRARIYLTGHQDNNAAEEFNAAWEADKSNFSAGVKYARLIIKTGRLAEARTVLTETSSRASHDPEYNIAEGELFMQLGKQNSRESEKSKMYFKKAMASETYKVTACESLAQIFNDEGNKQEAIRYYKLALVKDRENVSPKLAEVYYNLGKDIEDDDARAIQYYDSAIQYKPSNAEYYYSKAYAQMRQGKTDEAIESYKLSIDKDPDSEIRYFALGYAYHVKDDLNEALINYSKALDINPKYALALNNRSILYRQSKKFRAALTDIDSALSIQPDYPLALYNKGLILQDSGDYKSAIANYSQSILLDSTFMDCYQKRGESYYWQRLYPKAEKDLNYYVKNVNPDNVDLTAYYYLGVCQLWDESYPAAADNLSVYIKANNTFAWAYYFRVNVYRNMTPDGKNEKQLLEAARQDYIKAISLEANLIDAYFELSSVCDDQEEYDSAIEWSNKGIATAERMKEVRDLGELYGNLGWYLYEAKKLPEALQASRESLKRNDKLLHVKFNMGIITLCMGRPTEAKNYYDDAVNSLLKGNHEENEDKDKVAVLDDLGITDLKDLSKNSSGVLHDNAEKMIAYLESQKAKLSTASR